MIKKIAIIGPESTGKSTLSNQLALHYQTSWVPEYAREYLEHLNHPYAETDLLAIAKGQLKAEDQQLGTAKNDLLFCDTDLYVIKVWSEHKYNTCHPWILQQIAKRDYSIYLLTDIDIPWQNDPQREHPDPRMRAYFYNVYHDIVIHSGIPWFNIRGDYNTRLVTAVEAIESLSSA